MSGRGAAQGSACGGFGPGPGAGVLEVGHANVSRHSPFCSVSADGGWEPSAQTTAGIGMFPQGPFPSGMELQPDEPPELEAIAEPPEFEPDEEPPSIEVGSTVPEHAVQKVPPMIAAATNMGRTRSITLCASFSRRGRLASQELETIGVRLWQVCVRRSTLR
jgi:hypothetical protein